MTSRPSHFISDMLSIANGITADRTFIASIEAIVQTANESKAEAFVFWDLFDEAFAKTPPNTKASWVQFRKQFEEWLFKQKVEDLEAVFAKDPEGGWKSWVNSLIEATSFFRDAFCVRLANHPFSFPAENGGEAEALKKTTRLIRQAQWAEAYDRIELLSQLDYVPIDLRATLTVILGEIQLYHFADPEKAKELFEKAENIARLSERVAHGFGEYWLQKKEVSMAEVFFEKALAINPNWPWTRKKIGEVYESKGELQQAEKWYQDIAAYENLIKLYGNPELFKERKKAIPQLLTQAIEVNPENEYSIYIAAGYAYEQNCDFEEAQKMYDRAIRLDESRLEGYVSKGYCFIGAKDYLQAQAAFEKAISSAPEAYDGYWGLSTVKEQSAQWQEALKWLEESRQRRPQWDTLIVIKTCDILWKMKQYTEATEKATAVLQK
ncbi:MAG: tetratricopeptide repeat protein, partial [Bacteroidota bacterium]|nr:tetratricopeptide repeat protein [Bacteroidota bacterium]